MSKMRNRGIHQAEMFWIMQEQGRLCHQREWKWKKWMKKEWRWMTRSSHVTYILKIKKACTHRNRLLAIQTHNKTSD